jgi:hypothetical protein
LPYLFFCSLSRGALHGEHCEQFVARQVGVSTLRLRLAQSDFGLAKLAGQLLTCVTLLRKRRLCSSQSVDRGGRLAVATMLDDHPVTSACTHPPATRRQQPEGAPHQSLGFGGLSVGCLIGIGFSP